MPPQLWQFTGGRSLGLAQTSLSSAFSLLSLIADNTKIMAETIRQSAVLQLPADILRGKFMGFYCSSLYREKMHLHKLNWQSLDLILFSILTS